MRNGSFLGTVLAALFVALALHVAVTAAVSPACPTPTTPVVSAVPAGATTPATTSTPPTTPGPQSPYYCACGRTCIFGGALCWCESCWLAPRAGVAVRK